jgi:hypothetical protein
MKQLIFILMAIITVNMSQAQDVKTVSEMRKVMMGEDLSLSLIHI